MKPLRCEQKDVRTEPNSEIDAKEITEIDAPGNAYGCRHIEFRIKEHML